MEYGLIGEKLGHSASKEIHEQLADYSYELHPLTKKMNPAKMIVVGNRTIKEGVLTYEQCFALHSDADIVVNTSPVGMYPNVDFSPVDLTHFPQCQAVIDIIANPLTTKLVAQARELGMKGITGLEMLIAQAKYAVEIFLDTKIPEEKIDEIYQNMKKKS